MASASVLLRGPGWRLPAALDLCDPIEIRQVASDRPEDLPDLLAWLDDVSASRRPGRMAAGFLTYEAGVAMEGSTSLFRPPATPLAWFGLFDVGAVPAAASPAGLRRGERGSVPGRAVPRSGDAFGEGSSRGIPRGATDEMGIVEWTAAVRAVREGIGRGDVYQANLTRRIVREREIPPRLLAELLWVDNPVPFAICVETGEESVVSNSPELFLDVDSASGRVASSPIKGTVPRHHGGSEQAARAALLASEKDAAEHLMIVDLIRNDLGKVCEAGSVHVPSFRTVTTYRHLHHLESTVAGRLLPAVRLSDLLVATLPAGSITGAPKRAALGFIRRLEPVPRGPYTGVAGYVRGDGTAVLNVAIRTAVASAGSVAYHAGGGIVWDSDPLLEWEETETKSREFFRALAETASPHEVP